LFFIFFPFYFFYFISFYISFFFFGRLDAKNNNYNLESNLGVGGGLLAKLQKETSTMSYPAAEKNVANRAFSKRLKDFWSKLVHGCCSGTAPDISSDNSLMDQIRDQVHVVAHSAAYPFRHAALQSMTHIVLALGVKIKAVEEQMIAIDTKRQGEISKNKNKKANKGTEKMYKALKEKMAVMEDMVNRYMEDVSHHRYRDAKPEIRIALASAIGQWINANPTYFGQGKF